MSYTPQNIEASQAYRWTGSITLANGSRHLVRAAGVSFVRMIELSGGTPKIVVDGGDVAPIFKGLSIKFPTPVQRLIEVVNDTGASITFELIYGGADVSDDRVNLGSGGLDVSKATTLDSIGDVSCANAATTQLLAADTTRREWVVKVPSSATGNVRIGDSGAGAANGFELEPGAAFGLKTSDAVYCYNNTGSAIAVQVITTKD